MSTGQEQSLPPTPSTPPPAKDGWAEAFGPKWVAGIVAAVLLLGIAGGAKLVLQGSPAPSVSGRHRALGLNGALLTVPGWVREGAAKEQGLQRFSYCGVEPDVSAAVERSVVRYRPQNTASGPVRSFSVVQVVTRFRSALAAQRVLEGLAVAGRSCRSYETPGLLGGTVRVVIRPVSLDGATAFGFTSAQQLPLRGTDVIIRKASIISALEYEAPADGFDDTLWRQLAQQAITRLGHISG